MEPEHTHGVAMSETPKTSYGDTLRLSQKDTDNSEEVLKTTNTKRDNLSSLIEILLYYVVVVVVVELLLLVLRVLNNQLLLDKGSIGACSRYYHHTSSQHDGESLPNGYLRTEEHSKCLPLEPFDICQTKIASSPSLLAQNRKERKEVAEWFNNSEKLVLRDGMIKIIKKCQELGLGPGGFYQPVLKNGVKLPRQIMCFGKDWNPQSSSYKARRAFDGACPPSIPIEFRDLVEDAIQDSHTFLKQQLKLWNAEEIMSPDICLVNFYTETGMGLHQDKDESKESLRSGLSVVSFSISDSAEFLYGDTRDTETAEKVILESGDVLIFGGKSRLIYHGVRRIIPNSAPSFLVEEANLHPGRINLTFR
ncbi:uncharacterized protein LOC122643722 [Telopea speciosissima]|uniref:uncharacterized protein LOC122643722 n=1 Tax=Telopea speciosissima TaxID=54955 RepID=UPI001CC54468|nr:uncharacterized protein LOC122643722 [Telopea speciosissima]